ncbi:facilitated trehalose transporter Tret1-like [Homalodisca vitripennis]|uniref:facilitated trehalose transporter Tret1-like n=1 Tax=Homalodisca vitripennis TaxID=197043 RepID=UPI001EEB7061|nr:facilitated trehalose transporter Tret1-like [Homalodisca vitripennis]XP_046667555.1 facilitated trehalose transporter Tret1-like [Homalodisca vitripennis]
MELNGLQSGDRHSDGATQCLVSQESPYRTTTMAGHSRSNLYLACVAANIASFSIGNCFTWTSPTLPRLLEDNDILRITDDQSAWIGSLIAFGAIFGPLLAGALVNTVGRKWAITLSVVCITVSWVMLLFARTLWLMYTARVVAGMGGGIIYTVVPMYVAETAEDEIRGALGSMLAFFLCTGFLLAYLVGPYVSYTVLILASLVAPVTFLVVFPAFMPETPYFLLQNGKEVEAYKSLSWLRKGASAEDVKKELHTMKVSVEATLQESGTLSDLFSTTGNRKGLLLSCGLVAGQQLSGINVVLFYAESIFRMTGSDLSPSLSSTIVAVILILSAGIAAPLVKKFGMKWLLIISAIGMGVFQGLLGFYFYLLHINTDVSSLGWLPIFSLIGYITLYAIGFGPLPWAVMAEMFPTNVKAVGSALTASFCWVIGFLMTKFFVDVSVSLGQYISFWMFTFFCILMTFFTIFLLPDTRGMSFDEIQDILNNRRRGNS